MTRQGFALPLVIGIMVLTFLIAATVLQVAMTDFRASNGVHLSSRALLAAEAGAELTLAALDSQAPIALAPGDSVSTGWVELPGRAMYTSTTLRVDDGIGGNVTIRILTEGRADGRRAARSRVVLIAMCPSPEPSGLPLEPADPIVEPVVGSCAISSATATGSGASELSELARFRAK